MSTMARNKKTKATSDAVEILKNRYYKGNRARQIALENELLNARIAGAIYDLRTAAKLTQKQFAGLIGTTESVVSRLENADYNGHSLSMLKRIARAFGAKLEIRLLPSDSRKRFLTAPNGSKTKLQEIVA